jgi:hypothetical protein
LGCSIATLTIEPPRHAAVAEGGDLVNPLDIMPVLALLAVIVCIPLLSDGPP